MSTLCERSEFLICQVHHFFSRVYKKIVPARVPNKGELFLRGTLLGSGNSVNGETHWPEEDLIGQLQQCVIGKLIGQW